MLEVVEGRVDAASQDRIAEHASRCASCRELLSSLARHEDPCADTLVASDAAAADGAAADELAPGVAVGRYTVRARVGAGGMGVVYAAFDPELGRTVAVKLLRPELGDAEAQRQLEERLRREAQALAQIAHPNVVTVYDVGRHGERIFVAMELVDGDTLALWCRARGRSTGEIVARFAAAGRGLAAAHAVGMIHRDFKPENVLVGRDGRVRVVDFGLARSAGGAGDHGVLSLTAAGSVLGTPYYMAPEQRRGEDADARSDQYAFCVALDEALRGRRVSRAVQRAIARGRAESPAARHRDMATLLAAIEPRPRRWLWAALGGAAAAAATAVVVTAAAAGEPPELCRGAERRLDGVWDPTRKQAIRAALAATGAPFAERSYAELARVVDRHAARWVAMHTEACRDTRVHGAQTEEVLGLRMLCLDDRRRELAALGDRLVEADRDVAAAAVRAAHRLGDVAACADVAALSAPVRPPADAASRARVDELRGRLATVKSLRDAGRYRDGLAAARELSARAGEVGYRPLEAEARLLEGMLASELGEFAGAERSLAAAVWAAEASRHDTAALRALTEQIVVVGQRLARPAAVDALRPRATAALERLGRPAELEADLLSASAGLAIDAGKYDEAEAAATAALALLEQRWGPDDVRVSDPLRALGSIALLRSRNVDADRYFQRALAIRRRVLSDDHPEVAALHEAAAAGHYAVNALDAASASYQRAAAVYERAFGRGHHRFANLLHNRALVETWRGREDDALVMLREAVAIDERTLGPDHPRTIDHLDSLALTLEQVGRPEEALRIVERILGVLRRGADQPRLADALHTLARIELARGRLAGAETAALASREMLERLLGGGAATVGLLRAIGEIRLARGRPAGALEPLELAVHRLQPTDDPSEAAWTRALLGRALYDAGTGAARGGELVRAAHRVLSGDERAASEHAELTRWMRSRGLLR